MENCYRLEGANQSKQQENKQLTLASLIPVSFVLGRSRTRKAAKLAVYEATIIIAKPAHTIPSTRAEKLRGVPAFRSSVISIFFIENELNKFTG